MGLAYVIFLAGMALVAVNTYWLITRFTLPDHRPASYRGALVVAGVLLIAASFYVVPMDANLYPDPPSQRHLPRLETPSTTTLTLVEAPPRGELIPPAYCAPYMGSTVCWEGAD